MSWLTCWYAGVWLLCLPASDHQQALANVHGEHTWYNLYQDMRQPPEILHIKRHSERH
jgi:hypothetical protein